MTLIILLFAIGLVLLGFEVIIPGGVLGIFGGMAMIGGCVVAFAEYGVGGGVVTTLVGAALVALLLFVEFALLPKTKAGKRMFLQTAVSGTTTPRPEKDYTGSEGRTVTTLAPSGYVLIDGRRLEAFARNGYLEPDVPVKVVGVDNFRLIVIPNN